MKKTLVALVLVSLTATAAASPAYTLGRIADTYVAVKKDYGKSGSMKLDERECKDAAAELRSAGGKGNASNEGLAEFGAAKKGVADYEITADQADRMCAEVARLALAVKDLSVFNRLVDHARFLRLDMSPAEEYVDKTFAMADQCDKAVAALLANGLPPTFPYVITDHQDKLLAKTIGDLKPGVCDAARKAAKQFSKAAEEELAKQRAPYIKVGMAEDKLDLMMSHGSSMFLAGGAAPSDLKKYAKAAAWFIWTTSDPDAADFVIHTVRKYTFNGNKLVNETEKTYRKKRGAKLPGSVFK